MPMVGSLAGESRPGARCFRRAVLTQVVEQIFFNGSVSILRGVSPGQVFHLVQWFSFTISLFQPESVSMVQFQIALVECFNGSG
jgi:hypothetical protein